MRNTKIHFVLYGILSLVVSTASAGNFQNPEITTANYREIAARGKPDEMLCGFDVNKTTMKEIFSKLGKESDKKSDATDSRIVTFSWLRGPLRIEASAYVVDTFPNDHAIWIAAEGADPERMCATGRGLMLGDPFVKALKVYGKSSQYKRFPEGVNKYFFDFKWGEEDTEVLVSYKKGNGISRVEVSSEE